MDNKKQMQLRLFFNRSLSEKMTMDMITVISQHINTTEIVQAPNTNNQFYIKYSSSEHLVRKLL